MNHNSEFRGSRAAFYARGRDLTKGSILRNLLTLSWPMIVGNSVNMIGPTVDMIWVGRLGPDAIAGVGVSGIAVMLAQSGLMGLFQGLRSMVARYIGAGEEEKAKHTAQQAIVLGIGSSIVLALIGIFFAEAILRLVGVSPEVVSESAGYLRIQFIGMTAMSFRMMAEAIMQASGDAMTPMKIAVVFRLLHVVLSPALIFGWWIFPKLGVNGAAVTNVFSQSLGTALGFWILMQGRSRLRVTFQNFRMDFAVIWRVIRIGFPASIMGMQMNLGQFLLMFFVAPFGTIAVAAHTLNQRIEMIMFMPAWGVGMATGVLSGQNLGARQPGRAEKSGWIGTILVEAFTIICAICILLWAEAIVRIFSSNTELISLAATFLRIATAGYILTGFVGVLQQCISGAGDTFIPMTVSLLAIWAVQLPLAYFLSNYTTMGIYGIRWAIVASTAVNAIAYTTYFRMGRWKRKEI